MLAATSAAHGEACAGGRSTLRVPMSSVEFARASPKPALDVLLLDRLMVFIRWSLGYLKCVVGGCWLLALGSDRTGGLT